MVAESLLEEPTAIRVSPGDGAVLEAAREAASVPVAAVGPAGAPALEPLVLATREGRTAFHTTCTPERAAEVATRLSDGAVPADGADAVVEHDPGTARLPTPSSGPLGVGAREALGRAGWVRPTSAADHEESGGFADVGPDEALDRVDGLRGRGWEDGAVDADVAAQWRHVREADGDPAVVVNARGGPADRLLLESVPFLVLEGALAAARVVGTADLVVAVSGERPRERVAEAVGALPDPNPAIDVTAAPDEYRAGEPTMALEAIEGSERLEARLRPPGPEDVGLHGRPTLVHTPRTLAAAAAAVEGRDPGRLVTVTGDVAADATVELPEDEALSAALETVEVEGAFKAACVGGRFGGLARDLDVAADAESLADADLGTGGTVEVLAEDRCVVAFAGERARFAAAENCGRCVPCREGSTQLVELLREVYDGAYRPDAIHELARVMDATSVCAFGVDAPRPVRTALAAFGAEFEAHAEGRCPAGDCEMTTEVPA